jgi:hypothetical protein
MLRLLAAQAEPTRARPNIAMTKVRLCQRSRGTSLSRYSSSAASSYTSSIVLIALFATQPSLGFAMIDF